MSELNDLCPICGVGKNLVEYRGQTTELDIHFSICDACGSEQANAAQTRCNQRMMIAFKKRVIEEIESIQHSNKRG